MALATLVSHSTAAYTGLGLGFWGFGSQHPSNTCCTRAQGFGNLVSSKVLTDPKTGASKCAGFVRFSTPEEAARAMKEMNGKQVRARVL